jgi:hypothetical protein
MYNICEEEGLAFNCRINYNYNQIKIRYEFFLIASTIEGESELNI